MSDATPPISDILEKHAQVFAGVGKLKNYELEPQINPDVTPAQDAIRRIPYHTRKKVSAEQQWLQQLDIIQPFKGPTSWGNPIVMVEIKWEDTHVFKYAQSKQSDHSGKTCHPKDG